MSARSKTSRFVGLRPGLLFLILCALLGSPGWAGFDFGWQQAGLWQGGLQAQPVQITEGIYEARGINPNGTRYKGTCRIKKIGPASYEFNWRVGRQYKGTGDVQGRQITVYWGAPYPVIYKILSPTSLQGSWSNGNASETLRLLHRKGDQIEGDIESL